MGLLVVDCCTGLWWLLQGVNCLERTGRHQSFGLNSERGNFKLFGLIYQLYLKKFELLGARLLKKRVPYHSRYDDPLHVHLGGFVVGRCADTTSQLGLSTLNPESCKPN